MLEVCAAGAVKRKRLNCTGFPRDHRFEEILAYLREAKGDAGRNPGLSRATLYDFPSREESTPVNSRTPRHEPKVSCREPVDHVDQARRGDSFAEAGDLR